MKLAFCLFNYFPHGGLQRDFLRIAEECVRRGHAVDVFTMHWEGEHDPHIKVNVIPVSGWQNHTQAKHFVEQIQSRLKAYDLVIGFNKMPGLDIYYAADTCYQAKARKKHGFLYRLSSRYQHLVNYEASVFDEKSKTQIFLISPKQQPEFMRYYHTQENRFHLLPPGIAQDRIAPSNAVTIREDTRKEFSIKQKDYLLLMVGSGFKTKGLDRIILGLATLPDEMRKHTRLLVIGKDNASSFKKLAKKLHLSKHIQFLGGRDDVSRFFLAADLLLHPAYNENTGTVLLEAVVSGLPVLTTDVCGFAHYIQEANAGIVLQSPFQQKVFNQTLVEMLTGDQRTLWHENGLNFAKTADIYSLPERAVDLIEKFST